MWFPILARLPFALAGVVTGWFVAEGTVRYDIVQLGVSLVMLAAFLACGIYAPAILRALGVVRRRRR
ncbi:hypothetical protein [Agrobacterium pusense]|uniref:hypothetical protein n=1 Tax=Agrobacterium pusense TaxID=648995 RepID=UPI000888A187|nr:hypothetical protein [Agrobacterium pusense]OOO19709.1 hypothetical protein BTE56_13375 [Agrobacterium pusense]WKD47936.1 hypothetical protein M8C82_25545 [Agrobacterium pusense]SDF63975.1 hypothetical protein SAMN05421750_12030 [Agrobacterium pusense]